VATTLDDRQLADIQERVRECLKIADDYRHAIGDEDSILLMQNLRSIATALDIQLPERHIDLPGPASNEA
jgi:hypothetical protein